MMDPQGITHAVLGYDDPKSEIEQLKAKVEKLREALKQLLTAYERGDYYNDKVTQVAEHALAETEDK